MDRNSTQVCPDVLLDRFGSNIAQKMGRVNGLMLINAILMGIVVGVGTFAPRYRRNTVIRYLLLGASTLFLPIVSQVSSTVGTDVYFTSSLYGRQVVAGRCEPGIHLILVLVWTAVVVTIGVNTSTVVAGHAREGRRTVDPPTELLVKAIWVLYLLLITSSTRGFLSTTNHVGRLLKNEKMKQQVARIFGPLMVLPYIKIVQKVVGFYFGQQSVRFGRNPQLIVGYMDEQLEETPKSEHLDQHISTPPALVVRGEECFTLEEQPHVYILKDKTDPDQGNGDGRRRWWKGVFLKKRWKNMLVTLHRVWRLDDSILSPEHKDLCFSCALFKLLRCRFAKYTVSEAGFMKARNFFRREYIQSGHERVFRVIADELSFVHDYYCSSISVAYPHRVTASLTICISLMSIGYCLYMFVFVARALGHIGGYEQVVCKVWCPGQTTQRSGEKLGTNLYFGNTYYDVVPVYLVLALLMFSEAKDTVSYVCSNWTKVALVCSYVRHTGWQRSPVVQKVIGFVSKPCRSKLVSSSMDKMCQCSVLVLRPWEITLLPRRLLGFPNLRSTKVPSEVKEAVLDALNQALSSDHEGGDIKQIQAPLPPISTPIVNAISECHKSVADTILSWHIATTIFEVKDPQPQDQKSHKVSTTLSCYCAYLVSYNAELLPDDDEWCKKLYKRAKKNADHVLARRAAASTSEDKYQELIRLRARSLSLERFHPD
ncbi:unnamed protein product [Urochloa decumbens]|uniref:DUF4220 domain-containing protein n=1 Tax=Urochloa decumbens TaxID=240449 RepID=A0ABC9EYR6_9POAL